MEDTTQERTQELILALRNVTRATKKSKAFEIQHLVRKIRSLKEGKPIRSSNNVDSNTLEIDLNNIKSINVESLSKKILYIRLLKKPSLTELTRYEIFEELNNQSISLDKIENKISSSKSLAESIKQTISKLEQKQPQSKNKPIERKTTSETVERQTRSGNDGSDENEEDREEEGELEGDELDEAVARELAELEEGNTTEEEETEEDQSESSSLHLPPPSKKPKLNKSKQPLPSSSTFLPALNVGYTLGDSDASGSDIDDLAIHKIEQERGRKNRRGQQARRAIAEKKYGKSAKHLIKVKPKDLIPNPNHHHHHQKSIVNGGGGGLTGSNSEPLSLVKRKISDPKLHPSWIAKQNQIQLLSNLKPSGKKIVFD
ncbi:hypothetical protein MJO29_004354 [Puccinia striiformis f. sp. tritici]|uniref:Bud22 domain-containing protein n=2 Tax=Puccinia striiformis TaxID=27350 RepID=A0A0L0UVW9_9BASI|nr:hypothetical protein MJO29_004354 [Puccinia striiformis f. sp. tritici]KNE91076.1 hypothetical protein PSTG_15472 [Puccinia striiformis f. sp. tritici PST-78]POW05207.1 hypothetical protein PSTT_09855 [Puccinia striiformis]